MTVKTKKTTTKKAASPRKTPVSQGVAEATKDAAKPNMVQAMHPDAFRLAVDLVNLANIKGSDAETIMLLKRELARVAGQG